MALWSWRPKVGKGQIMTGDSRTYRPHFLNVEGNDKWLRRKNVTFLCNKSLRTFDFVCVDNNTTIRKVINLIAIDKKRIRKENRSRNVVSCFSYWLSQVLNSLITWLFRLMKENSGFTGPVLHSSSPVPTFSGHNSNSFCRPIYH